MQHTPEFVSEMKNALTEEKARLEAELATIAQKRQGDYQSNIPDYGRSDEDNATEAADYEAFVSTTETIESQLRDVVAALGRIEDGTYGVTTDGSVIPEDRLRANPSATTIITKE